MSSTIKFRSLRTNEKNINLAGIIDVLTYRSGDLQIICSGNFARIFIVSK